ncbi:hypothetical protein LTR36_008308 [Oleoguttula mirabilis]|uniref:Uncharacterized protein n=1 Tax=Oleoguttula mirabilis TaxID=1507867 RepID=A0AAV9J7P0_9PEZI|nr:hypothetical protein LTR36_008308 [Oleoguttula mirabilis]
MELGCTTELDQAMNDMNSLLKLTSAKPILFAVKTQLAERYGVLMHFNGGSAQSMTRDLAPSYFVNWPDELQATCLTHVHIPDSRVGSLGNCHLVSFKHLPSTDQVDAAKEVLAARLRSDGSRSLCTDAFRHSETSPTFAIDGSVGRRALDKTLSPLVKSALSQSLRHGISRGLTLGFDIDEDARPPRTVVIWTRQSAHEGRAHDRIVIAVEYASSSAHPWVDRRVKDLLPHDQPIVVVTPNPDRLTRRSNELGHLIGEITANGGQWWSQGAQWDGMRSDTWFDVTKQVESVQAQLDIGRQVALQMSFYARATHAITRFVVTLERDPGHWQAVALVQFIRLAADVHEIRCFVFLVRNSPPRGDEEARSTTSTLARQHQFLRAALPDYLEVRYITLQDTSAFTGDEVVVAVKEELQSVTGRAMVVSSTLDRATRSYDGHQKLKAVLEKRGHMAMALLWDTRTTNVDPAAAMLLPARV